MFVATYLSLLGKSERIARISGQEEVRKIPDVLDVSYYYREGEEIGKQGTTAQIIARIHLVATTQDRLDSIIRKIKNTLIVENDRGENLIIDI